MVGDLAPPLAGRSCIVLAVPIAGSDAGGALAAAIYSLIDTATLRGPDPEAYPRHVIGCIADHPVTCIDELLP